VDLPGILAIDGIFGQACRRMAEDTRTVAGVHPVEEALAAGGGVRRVVVVEGSVGEALRRIIGLARDAGVAVDRAGKRALERLAGSKHHQGVVAVLPGFPYVSLAALVDAAVGDAERALIVACDRVQDPGNLGAMIRSAAAFGATGVLLSTKGSVGVTLAAEKASAGTAPRVRVARVTNLAGALDVLRDAGIWVAGAVASGGEAPQEADLRRPLCLAMGSEDSGLRPGVERRCELRLTIPLAGDVESLNVSVAAGILLHEVRRQQG
jgi:23S rRNA (guanosine2251-2'-O)-methyltransferase